MKYIVENYKPFVSRSRSLPECIEGYINGRIKDEINWKLVSMFPSSKNDGEYIAIWETKEASG